MPTWPRRTALAGCRAAWSTSAGRALLDRFSFPYSSDPQGWLDESITGVSLGSHVGTAFPDPGYGVRDTDFTQAPPVSRPATAPGPWNNNAAPGAATGDHGGSDSYRFYGEDVQAAGPVPYRGNPGRLDNSEGMPRLLPIGESRPKVRGRFKTILRSHGAASYCKLDQPLGPDAGAPPVSLGEAGTTGTWRAIRGPLPEDVSSEATATAPSES